MASAAFSAESAAPVFISMPASCVPSAPPTAAPTVPVLTPLPLDCRSTRPITVRSCSCELKTDKTLVIPLLLYSLLSVFLFLYLHILLRLSVSCSLSLHLSVTLFLSSLSLTLFQLYRSLRVFHLSLFISLLCF